MGLKSGSRDAGLDDDEEAKSKDEDAQSNPGSMDSATSADEQHRSSSADETDTSTTATAGESKTTERPTMDSIPYKLRRDKVNEGREQVPYFLREEVIDAEPDLQDTLEEILGESVYKSDYREAAMVVAQRNPELIAEVLREWGYDLDAK